MSISYGPPLPVGIESECEYADLYLIRAVEPQKLQEALNKALPQDIKILTSNVIDQALPSLSSEIAAASYIVEIGQGVIEQSQVGDILNSSEIKIIKNGKEVNIRPMIFDHKMVNSALHITLQIGAKGNLKPEEIMALFPEIKIRRIKRIKVFRQASGLLSDL